MQLMPARLPAAIPGAQRAQAASPQPCLWQLPGRAAQGSAQLNKLFPKQRMPGHGCKSPGSEVQTIQGNKTILPFIQSTTCLGVHLLIGSITRAIIRSLYRSHQNRGGKGEKNCIRAWPGYESCRVLQRSSKRRWCFVPPGSSRTDSVMYKITPLDQLWHLPHCTQPATPGAPSQEMVQYRLTYQRLCPPRHRQG